MNKLDLYEASHFNITAIFFLQREDGNNS